MKQQHLHHQIDDSDLVDAFSVLASEPIELRAHYELDLKRSMQAAVQDASTSRWQSWRTGWAAHLPRLHTPVFRPVMAMAAVAMLLIVVAGAFLGAQLYTIGGSANRATLSVQDGDVVVTRAVHVFGDIELSRRLNVSTGDDIWVYSGDTITCGSNTRAELLLPDQSTMEVGALSELHIGDIQARTPEQPLEIVMRLERGGVRTKVQHLQSASDRFEVKTPNLVASVKGTVFRMAVSDDGTRVATDEGLVRVDWDGRGIDVAAGQELQLLLGQTVSEVDVRPQSPRLGAPAPVGSESAENEREFYTNASVLVWQIQSLPGAQVLFYVDGELSEQVVADEQGLVRVELAPPAEGVYEVSAVAEMSTGGESLPSPAQTIIVDRTPPSLVLLSPTDPQIPEDQIIVSGKTEFGVQLSLNETPLTVDEKGYFEHALDLTPGANEFVLVATDPAGNAIRLQSVVIHERSGN